MGFACAFTGLIMALCFYAKTNRIYNPGTIFSGYWAVIVLLSVMNLDNAVPVRESTYGLILFGMVSFAFGCFVCMSFRHGFRKSEDYHFDIPDYSILYLISILIILYSAYRLRIIASFLLRGMSWGQIRLMHGVAGASGAGTLKGGNWSQMIHDFIIGPCIYMLAPLIPIDLFLGRKNKTFLGLSFLAMVTYSLSTVSRAIWAFSILYLAIVLVIFMKNRALPRPVRRFLKIIPFFILFLFLVILFITRSRSATSQVNLFYNMLAYLTGGIKLFDLHMQEPIAEIRTYGLFTLYGFVYPVFFVLNYLGIRLFSGVFADITTIKQSLETFVTLSPHIRMNAYCTLFFNFYNDFGIFGIFLGSFLFGYFCMLAYTSFIRKKDVSSFACYLILVQFMIFSMARIYTIYTTRALSLVWLFLLLPKDRIRLFRDKGQKLLNIRMHH